jgi:hypothetical protein
MIARLRLAWQLARCAMLHGLEPWKGGWRCKRCNPVRPRAKQADATDERQLSMGAEAHNGEV